MAETSKIFFEGFEGFVQTLEKKRKFCQQSFEFDALSNAQSQPVDLNASRSNPPSNILIHSAVHAAVVPTGANLHKEDEQSTLLWKTLDEARNLRCHNSRKRSDGNELSSIDRHLTTPSRLFAHSALWIVHVSLDYANRSESSEFLQLNSGRIHQANSLTRQIQTANSLGEFTRRTH